MLSTLNNAQRFFLILVAIAANLQLIVSYQNPDDVDDPTNISLKLLQNINKRLSQETMSQSRGPATPSDQLDVNNLNGDMAGILHKIDKIQQDLTVLNDYAEKANRNLQCIKANHLNWIRLESGLKYYYSDYWRLSWYKAKAFCENSGASLASIRNEKELKDIYEFNPNRGKNPWVFVSATDMGKAPGNFYWADGSRLDRNSTLWLKGQNDPDAYGLTGPACVYMINGKLADATCNNYAYFVCEASPECL